MPRLCYCLLGALVLLVLPVLPARAQSERILLVGGNYRLQGTFHNMQDGFFGAPPSSANDSELFFDTRLRLFFDIRPSPLILVNYKMEVGDVTFGAETPPIVDADGRRLENVGEGSGGRPGADGVNIETKNAYLDVQVPWVPGLSFRGGIIGWGDQFDWTILATDFTGLQLTYQRQAVWTQFTFLKFAEGSLRKQDDSNWFALDARWGLTARSALTGSVYLWDDKSNNNPVTGRDAYQLYAGLKFNTVLFEKGLLEISGVYNRGQEFLGQACQEILSEDAEGAACDETPRDSTRVRTGLTGSKNQGVMANMHFDYPIGRHWLGLTLQYISGEKGSRVALDGSGKDIDAFLGLFNSQYTGFGLFRYTEGGGLLLTSLGQLNDSTAGLNNIAVSPYFGGSYNGRIMAVLRARFYVSPVVVIHAAAGLDQAARNNVNGDSFRGAEIASYVHWDIFPKLWLRAGGAFMLTGEWWKNNPDVSLFGFPEPVGNQSDGSADNIFQFMMRLQYNFG